MERDLQADLDMGHELSPSPRPRQVPIPKPRPPKPRSADTTAHGANSLFPRKLIPVTEVDKDDVISSGIHIAFCVSDRAPNGIQAVGQRLPPTSSRSPIAVSQPCSLIQDGLELLSNPEGPHQQANRIQFGRKLTTPGILGWVNLHHQAQKEAWKKPENRHSQHKCSESLPRCNYVEKRRHHTHPRFNA
ncbi:hypothetical protein [Nocardia sp. CA-119907]|uniref:hypothetical protein n=1 Tax=Nocardia sp. CA-119907 TaxID=3239973 RepID=UPI003D9921E1